MLSYDMTSGDAAATPMSNDVRCGWADQHDTTTLGCDISVLCRRRRRRRRCVD